LPAQHRREKSVCAEIIPFHHIARETGDDDAPLGRADFPVHRFGGQGDFRSDQIEPAEPADAGSGFGQRGVRENVLEHAARVGERHKGRIVMLGDVWAPPGPQDPVYEVLGARVARIASHLVVVGDNTRKYETGARQAGADERTVTHGGRTPQEAAEALRKVLQPGDVVLIKGHRRQRLDRVRMILQGRRVLCDLHHCELRTIDCEQCPMLETGWAKHRVIM